MTAHWLALMFPLGALVGFVAGGWYSFAGPIFIAVFIPIIDRLLAEDGHAEKESRLIHSLALWIYPLAHAAIVFWGMDAIVHASGVEIAGLVSSAGVSGGVGITAAHELIHRRSRLERGLGLFFLTIVCYPHYRVEHVFGHHRKVATPEDPATGRLGEGVYLFWLRCIPSSYLSAWRIENKRVGAFSLRNRMWHYLALQTAMLGAVFTYAGVLGLLFVLGQGLYAILLLETINYVEHYGLTREKLASGEYEPYRVEHSWDSGHRTTNWLTFNVGRHSHHHQNPFTEYPRLAVLERAPRLPGGYATMIILALVPPLWRRVIHPRLPVTRTAP